VRLADLALPVPLAQVFTYAVPDALASRVVPGVRAVCPFGARRLVGVVLAVRARDGELPPNVRPLQSVLDTASVPEELLDFARELAAYYMAPIGEVVRLALPPLDKETSRAMAEPRLFAEEARGVGARKVQYVRATGVSRVEETKLGGQAHAILAHVRAVGEAPLARVSETWKNARAATKRLAELGLVHVEERAAPDDPFFAEPSARDAPPELTEHQAEAARAIDAGLAAGAPKVLLLHGVTGSGKTEVYLRAIAAARAHGRGAIVLVPEIALTPQLVARYRARFGDDVAVLHSGLTPKERFVMWRRLRDGEIDVAIGARSALFAPVAKLGLVVVDEEHDPSFKQEEGVRYHARDMAILRAHRAGGVCVLGSATPSLESEHLARVGKATKLRLPGRARAQAMPSVEIVDLRRIGPGPTGDKRISIPLHRALEKTLEDKGQAILFLNRRGFAPSVRCEACGEMLACPQCAVSLTFHKRAGALLRCHYCEHEEPMLVLCRKCGARALTLEGLGTEKLEETLAAAFPSARVARLDRDVGGGKAVEKLLARMRAREIDILVGTQMVTKGHDLPHVTLVGVINADAALSIPDFRAAERAFQLLVQVAGRAGRGDAPGRVLVQTYQPENDAIRFAVRHDVDGFLEAELRNRKELLNPPFTRAALVRTDAHDESAAAEACAMLARVALAAAREEPVDANAASSVAILGPSPAPLTKLRNRFRFRLMLRSADRTRLRRVLAAVDRARASVPRAVRTTIDVDPVQLL
jgi:primosomal protein N' (replication factor Y) (superfamily II helicase)